MRRDLSFIFGYVVRFDMNFIYKKCSMLNFKKSVAKVKSAPNFGKVRKTSIQTSITKKVIFFGKYEQIENGSKFILAGN